jgi:hypothetical protein
MISEKKNECKYFVKKIEKRLDFVKKFLYYLLRRLIIYLINSRTYMIQTTRWSPKFITAKSYKKIRSRTIALEAENYVVSKPDTRELLIETLAIDYMLER